MQYSDYIRFRHRFRHRYYRLYNNTTNATNNITSNINTTPTNTFFTFRSPSPSNEITFKSIYSNSKIKINNKEFFCPICQSDVEINTEIIRELKCNHVYHVDCIDQWLILKNECPLCKDKLN